MPGHNVTRQKKGKGGIGRKTQMEIITDPEETQLFAIVEKENGHCQFNVKTLRDNMLYKASLCGNVKKKAGRVMPGDTVLIQSHGDKKYKIICKYTHDQRRMLEKTGKIVKFIAEDQAQEAPKEEEDAFEFEDEAKKRAEKDQLTLIQELYDESMIDNL